MCVGSDIKAIRTDFGLKVVLKTSFGNFNQWLMEQRKNEHNIMTKSFFRNH